MTTGIIALAVPGSARFAGEFLILAGVFDVGLGLGGGRRGGDRARGDVHAAADLGGAARARAAAPSATTSLDLRPVELALVVPLVAALLALSAWPAVDHRPLVPAVDRRRREALRVITTPKVDWLALSPTLALLGASGVALLGSVLVPRWMRRGFSALVAFAGFVTAGVFAAIVFDESAEGRTLIAESFTRDRLGALAAIIVAGAGALAVLVSWGEHRRDHAGEYYALLAAAGAGMAFFVTAGNLMTLFLGLEWFSIALYILCALDTHRETLARGGAEVPDRRQLRLGDPALRLGARLRRDRRARLLARSPRRGDADDALLLAGLAMLIAGLGFKASAAPFHMWTPDVYEGAPTSVTAFMAAATKVGGARRDAADPRRRVPRAGAALDDRDRGARVRLARGRQPRRARAAEREAAARLLVRLARRLHADRDRGEQRARRHGAPLLPDPLRRDVDRRVRRRRGARARARRRPSRSTTSAGWAGSGRSSAPRCGCSCSASLGCRSPAACSASSTSSPPPTRRACGG